MLKIHPTLDTEDQFLYGCLAMQHRLGYAGMTRLLEVFKSPRAIYAGSNEELKAAYPKLTAESIESIRRGPDRSGWEKIVERCDKLKAQIVAPGSPGYPEPLCALNDPPPLLFIQGSWIPKDVDAVAMVGTRKPTAYGRKVAFDLARDLVQAGQTVVSGFAIGVDAESHTGALEGGGRTLAVIGCGLDIPYPQENQALKERIIHSGAMITEFPPGAHPKRDHFPRRNRILSALARATVVVEAGEHSGALLTAAHARAQGKHLLSVPGSIYSPVSIGTHSLLQRGAFLAASAADILTAVRSHATGAVQKTVIHSVPLKSVAEIAPAENEPVLELWRGEETCGLDRLTERARESNLWPPGRAMAALMESLLRLEIRGLVQRLPVRPSEKRHRVAWRWQRSEGSEKGALLMAAIIFRRMTKQTKKKQPWIRWILLALLLFALYHILSGPNGLWNLRTLKSEQRAANHRIDSLTIRLQELEAEKQRLLTDSVYLEKLARQELGMAKPKEKVYKFVAPVTNGSDSSVTQDKR